MHWIIIFVVFATSPVFTAVSKDPIYSCSLNEFSCADGACVSAELVCDGTANCADRSDELYCNTAAIDVPYGGTVLNRVKRQAACRKNQWRCKDNTCIPFDGKCDGAVDCPDGSDETHALCRKTICQSNWFRCTYGACVDGTAPCNGLQECADNSDELLPRCRNETDEIRGQFRCQDGTFIPAANHCDGVSDCPDGSDETVRACAAKTCPSYLFQCAYGACVDSGADCNGVQECADGSDESKDLCGKSGTTTSVVKPQTGSCVLPPYPDHGTYVTNIPGAQPGQGYKLVTLNVTCQRGYGVLGSSSIYCFDGFWPESLPKCVRQCQLNPHPSVEYRCLVSGKVEGVRACNAFEPAGTVVRPECRKPNYYSATTLTFMRCIDGYWDYVARCTPGLTKTGTNITILIKDTVEVHQSQFQYVVPFNLSVTGIIADGGNIAGGANIADATGNIAVGTNNGNNNNAEFSNSQVVPIIGSAENDINYDIDETDWRMGSGLLSNNTNKANINFNINNSSVFISMFRG